MKIYISHLKNFDFVNELYKPIRESRLNSEHSFILPHENSASTNSFEAIKGCDLVIAEVSYPATGQGIELGWANMLKKPIYCISKEGRKISNSLKFISTNFSTYKDSDELMTKISSIIDFTH